jgi:hypothetical protein
MPPPKPKSSYKFGRFAFGIAMNYLEAYNLQTGLLIK